VGRPAARALLAASLASLLLTGCGGPHRTGPPPAAAVALRVAAADRGAPFDVPRRLVVPAGWSASVWARLAAPRLAAWTPEGDLLVGEPALGRIVRLEPRADPAAPPRVAVLAAGLNAPQGLAFDTLGGKPVLYVAEADRLDRYAWRGRAGLGARTVVAGDLPDANGVDRLKSVAVGPDHTVYVSVGSTGTRPVGLRAVVLAFRPGGARVVFASGVRNAEGLAFGPDGRLWVAANGGGAVLYPYRRGGGYGTIVPAYADTHPPDELAALDAGRDLGWPYCNPEPDVRPGVAGSALRYASMPFVADVRTNPRGRRLDCRTLEPVERGLPAHSAPLGLHFVGSGPLRGGAILAVHGSFSPTTLRAPAVLWLPWTGSTLGPPRTLVAGFQSAAGARWGRPVDGVPGPDGALYVTDDEAGAVYRIAPP
jgi:glucose/arabinose dehydrogenase